MRNGESIIREQLQELESRDLVGGREMENSIVVVEAIKTKCFYISFRAARRKDIH